MVRRGNLFDESKIIKKEDVKNVNTSQNTKNIVEEVLVINENKNIVHEKSINISNQKELNETTSKKSDETIEQIIKNDFPVFMVSQNKHTGQIDNLNVPRQHGIKVNIPKDQLQLINVNNNKNINELTLDLAILDSLLKSPNDNYNFYKNKFDYLSLELEFANKKKDIIKKLLEG